MAAVVAGAALAACAGGGGAPPDPGGRPEPPEPEPTEEVDEPERPDRAAEALELLASRTGGAPAERRARTADSLFFRWVGEPALRGAAAEALRVEAAALEELGRPLDAAGRLEEALAVGTGEETLRGAAGSLARLRLRLGREPAALAVLDRWPGAADSLHARVRRAAGGMSVRELREAAGLFAERPAARGIVAAERARALALAGRTDSARAAAERALAAEPPAPERELARAVAAGEVSPAGREPPRIGLVLPLSGSLESVGRLLRETAVLAAEGTGVELVVRDDSSRAETAARIVGELERAGVTAVVGPVTSAGLRAALRARTDPALPVISPAASSVREPAPNAYSLWERDARVSDLARALGAWVPARTGLRKLALLRAESATGRAYEHAFRSGARRAGGWVAAAGTFEPDSTNFSGPVRWLAAHRPESLLVGSGTPRTVLQMAPQLSYYGLRSSLVAGTSAWGEPGTVRRLAEGFPSRWIAAVFADRTAEGTAWAELRTSYERRYRRGLPSRMLAGLAYDAVGWATASLGPGGLPRRGVVARGLADGPHAGASGRFHPRPRASTVRRRARVRMAAGGELHPPDTAALHAWRREARGLVEAGRRRRREEADRAVRRWIERHSDELRVPRRSPPAGPGVERPPEEGDHP